MQKFSFSPWLIFVLILATVIRFYGIWDQEFSYDELSAIFRAENAHNWHEHILHGVIPDGHPAGLQTFIWIWINLFGTTLFWLKGIMAMCGIISVYFIYKTGKNLFNEQTAVLASTLLAVLYLPVFWSLQLRPYAPALLIVSGLFWTSSELLFNGSQKRKHYLLGILFLTGAFYLHYFAALTGLCIVSASLFLCHKNQRLSLFLCLIASVILFIPHIEITLQQFSNKGLGWLSKPDSGFFTAHLLQIFSHSWLLFFLGFIIAFTGIFLAIKNKQLNSDFTRRTLFLTWVFLVPLFTGYIYSLYRAPVLQDSVLLFSMPAFLLILSLASGFIPIKIQFMQTGIFIFCSVILLVYGRKFYAPENWNAYRSELEYANYYAAKYGKENVTVWMDGENDILEYHIQKNLQPGVSYNRLNFYPTEKTIHMIENRAIRTSNSKDNYLALGLQSGSNGWLQAQLEERFGKPQDIQYCNGGAFLLFDLNKKPDSKYNKFTTAINPVSFAGEASLAFDTLNITYQDFMVVRLKSIGITGEIQSAISCGTDQIDWRSSEIKPYDFFPGEISYSTSLHVIKLADIPKWNKKCVLKMHIKTAEINAEFPIQEMGELSWRIMKGNPYMYGIYP